MKKICITLFVCLIMLTGCSSKTLKKISINEVKEKISNKESFILYFDSKDDDTLEKKLISVLEEFDITGYKVNTSKISSDEKSDIEIEIPYEEGNIVFIINGKDPSVLSHIKNSDITKSEIKARLIDMGYVDINKNTK